MKLKIAAMDNIKWMFPRQFILWLLNQDYLKFHKEKNYWYNVTEKKIMSIDDIYYEWLQNENKV